MRILVFQHVAVEHPGSFGDVIAACGHSMHQVELDEGDPLPKLGEFDVLIVMGGPMDVWEEQHHPWLAAEKRAIRAWVTAGRPYLGMCLGEQLLADAMGGSVALMKAPPEVGMSEETMLEAVQGEGALARLGDDVADNLPVLQSAAHKLFRNFLAIAEDIILQRSAA